MNVRRALHFTCGWLAVFLLGIAKLSAVGPVDAWTYGIAAGVGLLGGIGAAVGGSSFFQTLLDAWW